MCQTRRVYGAILITMITIWSQPIPLVAGLWQPNQPSQRLIAVTQDSINWNNTVWEVDYPTLTKRPIYSIVGLKKLVVANDFSRREREQLEAATNEGIVPKAWLDSAQLITTIDSIWPLDEDRLLLIVRNELCQRLQGNLCFGYFELLNLNIPTKTTQPLLKVDFHDFSLEAWNSCPSGTGTVVIKQILPHPSRNKVAIVWGSDQRCLASFRHTTIVDFSMSKPNAIHLPNGGGLSWSPTGEYMAYYQHEAPCYGGMCELAVHVAKVQASAIQFTESIQWGTVYSSMPIFTIWTDAITVAFPWQVQPASSETPISIFIYNVQTTQKQIVKPVSPITSDETFALYQSASMLVVQFNSETGVQTSVQPDFAPIDKINAATNIVFNSRFPNQLLLIQAQPPSVWVSTILKADQTRITIDLSNLFEQTPNEHIIFIALGLVS